MSTTPLTVTQKNEELAKKIEQVMILGDLASLSAQERVMYYNRVCESIGLNPDTKPFDYITLNGKLTLYAKRDCTDQLRSRDGVSINITSRGREGDIYSVTARARNKAGREDESMGCVAVGHLKGEMLANALMKCETKAKRRATLSICGLGLLDETEVETIKASQVVEAVATTDQIGLLLGEMECRGITIDYVLDYIDRAYKKKMLKDLSESELSTLSKKVCLKPVIESLKTDEDAQEAPGQDKFKQMVDGSFESFVEDGWATNEEITKGWPRK